MLFTGVDTPWPQFPISLLNQQRFMQHGKRITIFVSNVVVLQEEIDLGGIFSHLKKMTLSYVTRPLSLSWEFISSLLHQVLQLQSVYTSKHTHTCTWSQLQYNLYSTFSVHMQINIHTHQCTNLCPGGKAHYSSSSHHIGSPFSLISCC